MKKKAIDVLEIAPVNDNVLVERSDIKRDSPIIMPKNVQAKGELCPAIVIAVGPGGFHYKGGGRVEMQVQPGNTVLIDEFAGDKLPAALGKRVMVQMHEIKGIVRKAKKVKK